MPRWAKGQSGNPKGRPKTSIEAQSTIRELALGDIEAAYARLRKNGIEDGETAALVKILAFAGVKADADAAASTEDKRPPAHQYANVSTDDLLQRAGYSSTLPT